MTQALETASRIDGRYWWESDRLQYVATYNDVGVLNAEIQLAAPFGWYIDETTGTGGRHSVGAMAMGAFVLGLPGLALGSGRGPDTITVTWRRDAAEPVPATDAPTAPLVLLRQLKSMLDEGLITSAEYQAKKQDLLARM